MTEVHKISTPATGLETLEARIPRRDGEAPAYLAKPAGVDNCPIILIAQEVFGLNDHIRDIARRFAALGYLAIAPDFFAGVGDPTRAPDLNAIRAIVAKNPGCRDDGGFRRGAGFPRRRARRFGPRRDHRLLLGRTHRLAFTRRITQVFARRFPWYGRLDGDHTPNHPRWPVDIAGGLKVPALGLYGGADPSIPLTQVEEMRARLSKAGAPGEIHVYEGAPHAFFRRLSRKFSSRAGARRMGSGRCRFCAPGASLKNRWRAP